MLTVYSVKAQRPQNRNTKTKASLLLDSIKRKRRFFEHNSTTLEHDNVYFLLENLILVKKFYVFKKNMLTLQRFIHGYAGKAHKYYEKNDINPQQL